MDGSSECVLMHSTAGATATCGPGSAFKARPGAEFGTSATSYSSTLSRTATSALNGTLVECFGPDLVREPSNKVGESCQVTTRTGGGCSSKLSSNIT